MDPSRRSVVVCGATGLVGGECLRRLLADPTVGRVVALVRRPLAVDAAPADPRLAQQVVDFDRLAEQPELLRVEQLVCALGTTMRQAGSREAFRRVDHDYPLELARLGAAQGVRHFLLVTAIGADARSRVFYNRVKGELEGAVVALPYRSVSILRPSLLVGERAERRRGEELAARLGFLVPARYKPIRASDVAAGVVRLAREDAPGRRVVENAELRDWARTAAT